MHTFSFAGIKDLAKARQPITQLDRALSKLGGEMTGGMRLASDLREAFWGFLQSGISTLEFDFRAYALKHLERFLQNAADRQFSNYLQQCGN